MKRAGFMTNVIMALMIVVLGFTLLYTVLSYRTRENDRTESLRQDAERARDGEDMEGPADTLPPEGEVLDEMEEGALEETQEAIPEEMTEEADEEAILPAEEDTEPAGPLQISCRGESWQIDDADPATGWPAKLNALFRDYGLEAEITDATWDMAGSMSHLRLAGVSEATVDEFIRKHRDAGLQDDVYEMIVREDLADRYTERTDLDFIPVISLGYNGGYGRTVDGLKRHFQVMLGTYHLQDGVEGTNDGTMGISGKYILIAHLPATWEDPESFDRRMTDAWGDHFISLNDIEGDVLSDEYRQAVAQKVFDRMAALGYLE